MKVFERNWNFPNCIEALDGQHIVIKKLAKPGSLYIDYKKSPSIILVAVGDTIYQCQTASSIESTNKVLFISAF